MKGSKVTDEFLRRMNIDEDVSTVDLYQILSKLLSNYVHILFNEKLADKFDLLCCLDTNGEFIYICPKHYVALGYYPEELYGVNGSDVIHPDDFESISSHFDEVIRTKKPSECVYRFKHKQGYWITIRSICTPFIADGEVLALINFSNLQVP